MDVADRLQVVPGVADRVAEAENVGEAAISSF
jgi:hypothetical protein